MSICVPHPNFGCLIRHCALFRQNASGVYASGPGPWEVSPASSGTLQIMTASQKLGNISSRGVGISGSLEPVCMFPTLLCSLLKYVQCVRVQPCILDPMLFRCISNALPCTLMHHVVDSVDCTITVLPPASMPLHVPLLVCLFVYLFTFVIGTCVVFFVCLFPLPVVSDIDRQQANAKSNCACCIRRGLVMV